MDRARSADASPPTMLAAFGQYSTSGYISHEPQDIKPLMQCRVTGHGNGNGFRIHQHSSPMYPVVNTQPDSLVYVLPSDSKDNTSSDHLPKSAGSRWREEETMALVEVWRDKICQTRWWKQNKCVRVNKEMWDEISAVLVERGVFRTASQCQIRMKNLLQYFRQMVDHRRSEKAREELPDYFDIVNSIMNGKADGEFGHKPMLSDDDDSDDVKNLSVDGEQGAIDMKESGGSRRDKRLDSDKLEVGSAHRASTGSLPNCNDNNKTASASPRALLVPGSQNGDGSTVLRSQSASFHYISPSYQSREMSSATHVDQGYENASIVQNSLPERLSIPPRTCLSTFPPPSLIGHYQDASMRSMGRCTVVGCCGGEPPAKRPCFDNNCALNQFSRKSNVPIVSQGPCKVAMENDPTQEQESMSSAMQRSSPSSFKRENDFHQYGYKSNCNAFAPPRMSTQVRISEDWMHSVKEILLAQQKQMDSFLEIERHRLRVEERKLKMQEDADCRNGAFLMEAVRILAEAFSKNDGKQL